MLRDATATPLPAELEESLLRERMPKLAFTFREDALAERINRGLRATLQTECLVTGVLYVGLDMDPKASPPIFHQLEKLYPEVPTEPTKTQQLFNNLASLDIKSIETNVTELLTQLRSTVGELKMADINAGTTNLLASINRLVTDSDITNGLAAIRPTLDQYRELGAKMVIARLASLHDLFGCSASAPYENSLPGSLSEHEVAIVRLGLINEIKDEAGNTLTATDKYGSTKHPKCRLVPGMYSVRFDHWGMPFHDPRDQNPNNCGMAELKAGHRYEAK